MSKGRASKVTHSSAKPLVRLPPAPFSNAMVDLFGTCKLDDWQNSKEWLLWLAGAKHGTKISAWGCEEAYEELERKGKI